MNTLREIVAPVLFWLLVVCIVAGVMTFIHTSQFKSECVGNGGSYSISGGTAHCKYGAGR